MKWEQKRNQLGMSVKKRSENCFRVWLQILVAVEKLIKNIVKGTTMNTDKKLDEYIKLIEGHARVALMKIMKPAKYSLDDLIQEGVIAFLYAKQEFVESRGASFRTFLIKCLRNQFTNLVKKSYRNKEINDYSSLNETNSATLSTLEIVQISFVIKSFSADELEYVNAVLSLAHKSRGSRRKVARQNLGISYEREVELRNSIRDKIKK